MACGQKFEFMEADIICVGWCCKEELCPDCSQNLKSTQDEVFERAERGNPGILERIEKRHKRIIGSLNLKTTEDSA